MLVGLGATRQHWRLPVSAARQPAPSSFTFGSGFSVTGLGAGGGGGDGVLDPPGFAAPGWAGCAAGSRYVFVVPDPPVTSNMFCLAKWFDADWALFSLRPVALARSCRG
jgi:hypothetical protein